MLKQLKFTTEAAANEWLLSDEARQYDNYDTSFNVLVNGSVIIEFN